MNCQTCSMRKHLGFEDLCKDCAKAINPFASKFCITDKMLSILSFKERTKLHTDMKLYSGAHKIDVVNSIDIDEEGTLWWGCSDQKSFLIMSNWLNGYIMALGFNDVGERT